MTLGQRLWQALGSVLAIVMGLLGVQVPNLLGGALADAMAFPPPGDPRLAWDLAWVFVAGVLGTWLVVRLAPAAPRAHALAFFLLALGVDLVAVWMLGADWPWWFSAGVLLTLPLQVWLGMRLALPASVPVAGRPH